MASVAVIYAVRKLTSRTALEFYALAVSFVGIFMFVSVPHVAQNFSLIASHGLSGISTFVLSAVTHTSIMVQLTLLLGIGAVGLLLVDLVRSVIGTRNLAL